MRLSLVGSEMYISGSTNTPRPGRVSLALLEHARRDDWMSRTLLKHFLASVIQVHLQRPLQVMQI